MTSVSHKKKILLRADGNSEIGLGHVYRLLALVDSIKSDYYCIFIVRNPDSEIRKTILLYCEELRELNADFDFETEAKNLALELTQRDIIVLDGYNFVGQYLTTIKSSSASVIMIDDIHKGVYDCDYLINVGGENLEYLYTSKFYTQYLFGFRYAILRKEFHEMAAKTLLGAKSTNDNILICLGGADPINKTKEVVLECQKNFADKKFHIVIGSAYQHLNDLKRSSADHSNVYIHSHLSSKALANLMAECSTAVCSASTVAYEYLCSGGNLFLIQTADNQNLIYEYLISGKLANPFQDMKSQFTDKPNKKLIDSKLEEMVNFNYRALFSAISTEQEFSIRTANEDDLVLYYNWANDPETRAQSFNSDPISLEEHTKWFKSKLKNKDTVMLVMTEKNSAVGQLRFEIKDGVATINYSIDQKNRGKRLGNLIIRKSVWYALKNFPQVTVIEGFVKRENIASIKAFVSNKFTEDKVYSKSGDSYRFILNF